MSDFAAFTHYATPRRAGRLQVRVSREGWGGPSPPGRVPIKVGRLGNVNGTPGISRVIASRTWTVRSGTARAFTLPTPKAPYRLEIRVSPDLLARGLRPARSPPARRPGSDQPGRRLDRVERPTGRPEYTGPMADQADGEIAAIFARLKDEVRSRPAEPGARSMGGGRQAPLPSRAQAERAWAVTAERPFENPPTRRGHVRGYFVAPVKRVLRKLMRWYVEPVAAQQRTFNLAILTLVDELAERTEARRRAGSSAASRRWRSVSRATAPNRADENRRLRAAGSVRARRHRDRRGVARRAAPRPRSRGRARQGPVQVVSGAAAAARGARLAAARPRGGAGASDRPRDRDEVPVLRDPPSEQGRLARPPVPAGLRPRPDRARAVRRGSVRPRDGAGDPAARPRRRSARPAACSRSRGNVADRLRRSTGLEAEVLAAAAAAARLPLVRRRRRRSSSRSAGSTARSASTSCSRPLRSTRPCEVVVAGDGPDRERLEQLAAERGLDGRVTFAGRVDDDELVDLYADCLAVYYAPIDEDLGLVPVRGVPVREAGRHHAGRGRPARGRRRPRERARLRAGSRAPSPQACSWLAANPDAGARLRAAPASGSPSGSRGTPSSTGCSALEGRLLLAASARALRASPTTARCCSRRSSSGSTSPSSQRGAKKPPRGTDVALYHVGNNPDAHGWIVDALRAAPGLVVLHDFVLHHLVAGLTLGRGDTEGYLDAMQRDAGVDRPAARARRRRPPAAADLGGARRRTSRSPARSSTGPTASSATRTTSSGWRGSTATAARSGSSRCRPGRRSKLGARLVPEGRFPVVACVGHLNAAKRVPQLLDAFERRSPPVPGRAARPGRKRGARLRLDAGEPRRRRASARPPGRAGPLAAPRRLRRLRQPALADDGRDLRDGDPRALARQAARRQRRRLVLGAARLGRGQGAGRRARGRDAGRVPRAARGRRRLFASEWERPPPSTPAASTISTASPISTSPRSRRWPAGRPFATPCSATSREPRTRSA